MRATGAEVIKLAVTAARLADTAAVMALADSAPFADSDEIDGHVLLAMGQAGVPTRMLAARLRNRWTYAGDAVAPGQMPAERCSSTPSASAASARTPPSTASSATRSRTRCRR